jgi:hypothetical protein
MAFAKHQIKAENVKTLQAVVNDNWLDVPIMTLGSNDILDVGFDEMSHNYHRFVAHIEHCEADWSVSDQLFESDWLEGFNDFVIDDYENSLNTTVLYTHYQFQIPNDQCRIKMSGNYRIHVLDEDEDNEEVLVVELRVVEKLMNVGLSVTTNTDIDFNQKYQQINMSLNYNSLRVNNPSSQIQVFVLQNGREDNMKENVKPNYITPTGLRWEHNKALIFDAGNEYHKFEVLDPTHITMGLDRVEWNEEQRHYHVYPYLCEPQRNYLYTEDADGAFYIRNSDNIENNRLSDYVYVHYQLSPARDYGDSKVLIEGQWTTEDPDTYVMDYDPITHSYKACILQKMGYYNYQLLMRDPDGVTHRVPEEGSFYQTENKYMALVYYKGNSDRTWRLVGHQGIVFKIE